MPYHSPSVLQFQLRDELKADVSNAKDGRIINILDYLMRTTLELIFQGGLGHKSEYMSSKNQRQAVKNLQPSSVRLAFDNTPSHFNVFPISVCANQLTDDDDKMLDEAFIANMRFA